MTDPRRNTDPGDQLELGALPPARTRRTARASRRSGPAAAPAPARDRPVARVAVDVTLPHLDRPFDYLVTESDSAAAQPGVRVRVRFAGQLVHGYVLERVVTSDHPGRLSRLRSVVSSVPVLTPAMATLAREVADRYAGTLADVLRLAIPARHAAVERDHVAAVPLEPPTPPAPAPDAWGQFRGGEQLLAQLASGRSPLAAWCALPGVVGASPRWAADVVEPVVSTVQSARGAIVAVPDHRDVTCVVDRLRSRGVDPVVLTAELGPRERYRRWLRVLTESVAPTVVVGTRAAIYAPVRTLGLIVVWDDGDDLHAEPRAPYPHVREVAAMRATGEGCALVVGALARTPEVAAMVERGFLSSVVAERATVRAAAPRVRAAIDDRSRDDPLAVGARLPSVAWRAAREALDRGPVLVQVPRRGYLPRTGCQRCREPARCAHCQGPLTVARVQQTAACQWCGQVALGWRCPNCGGDRLRAHVVGATRTAEELGRAFPGTTVVRSGAPDVRATVGPGPALVVATPGAEPVARGGFAAALLLDAWALLGRVDVRASEETLRRWLTAAALVRPAAELGQVVVVADASIRAVQALVRWDPVAFAAAELAERAAVGMPPARRVAVLHGDRADVHDLLSRVDLPHSVEQLGPVSWRPRRRGEDHSGSMAAPEPLVQVVLRAPRRDGAQLARALAAAQGERSIRKSGGWVTVQIDPVGWG